MKRVHSKPRNRLRPGSAAKQTTISFNSSQLARNLGEYREGKFVEFLSKPISIVLVNEPAESCEDIDASDDGEGLATDLCLDFIFPQDAPFEQWFAEPEWEQEVMEEGFL